MKQRPKGRLPAWVKEEVVVFHHLFGRYGTQAVAALLVGQRDPAVGDQMIVGVQIHVAEILEDLAAEGMGFLAVRVVQEEPVEPLNDPLRL